MELHIEKTYFQNQKYSFFSGCDEVGRGPLAGPVVGATVTFFPHLLPESVQSQGIEKILGPFLELGVGDSKSLTEKKRISILKCLGIEVPQLKSGKRQLFKGKSLEAFSYSISAPGGVSITALITLSVSILKLSSNHLLFIANSALVSSIS